LPAAFWAIAWGSVAIGILALTLVVYYKSLVGAKPSSQLAVNFDDLLSEHAIGVSGQTQK